MRQCTDSMWQGLVYGQWLAHERRMQLLQLAAEIRLGRKMTALRKRAWYLKPIAVPMWLRRSMDQRHLAAKQL
jgi:hypothetical protein